MIKELKPGKLKNQIRIAETRKRYREKNPEVLSKKAKSYYSKNRGRILAKAKIMYAAKKKIKPDVVIASVCFRICRKCGNTKKLSLFVKSIHGRGGYSCKCKVCAYETHRKYIFKNPAIRKKLYTRYNRANRKRRNEYSRKYRLEHKEYFQKYRKKKLLCAE